MDENCGTVQMQDEQPSGALERSRKGSSDLCGGGCAETNIGGVCMPICFLVREQAKSIIAIKGLQKRMQEIEGAQEGVMSAISDVHDYLSVGPDLQSTPPSRFRSPSMEKTALQISDSPVKSKSLACSRLQGSSSERRWAQNVGASAQVKDSAPESDKQDSGLDSDCREQGQDSNPLHGEIPVIYNVCSPIATRNPSATDELSDLLDEIGERSEILIQHVSGIEDSSNQLPPFCSELSNLQMERMSFHKLMSDIKDERQDLTAKLVDLENTAGELADEKKELEQRFVRTLVEKHKLTGINGLKSFSTKSSESSKLSNSKTLEYKVNSDMVSSVLKETNIVDLQKQVLTCMMENEVLRLKMDQVDQLLAAKELERECLEKVFLEEVRQLMYENEQVRTENEEQKSEIAALLCRVRMLERVLQSTTAENQELNSQLAEATYLRDQVHRQRVAQYHNHTPSTEPYYSKRLSLPARFPTEQDINVRCAKSRLLSNTSSYIDITMDDPGNFEFGSTLDPLAFGQRKSSTPLDPQKKLGFHDPPSVPCFVPSAQRSGDRHPNKRLTFNSMKTLASPSNFSAAAAAAGRENQKARMQHCDSTSRRAFDTSGVKTLESIQETDPKKFPFYTILEKLKASSDYKLPPPRSSRAADPEETPGRGPTNKDVVEPNANQEDNPTQTKDKRSGSKNIHRRIQNILDRITAESESVVTAASAV